MTLADLKATFQLQIIGVKKNPQSPMYTQLGVMTKGTIIEVNVSELGLVTAGGKVSLADDNPFQYLTMALTIGRIWQICTSYEQPSELFLIL